MKRLFQYYLSVTIVSLGLTLFSCEPTVYFENTMPPHIDPLSEIPGEFQGVYLCESDNNIIYADNLAVYLESHNQFVTSIDQINQTESCSIVEGDLYLSDRKECVPFEYLDDDRILAHVIDIDTLFSFGKNDVAKMYKGRLFLNVKGEFSDWITFMITPQEHGILLWEMIEVPDDLSTLENLTNKYKKKEYYDRDPKYVINPTLKEFDEILDRQYTLTCDYLIPINLEK